MSQEEHGPLTFSHSVVEASGLQAVSTAHVLSGASFPDQLSDGTANVNQPAGEKAQEERGPLTFSHSVDQATGLQAVPTAHALSDGSNFEVQTTIDSALDGNAFS